MLPDFPPVAFAKGGGGDSSLRSLWIEFGLGWFALRRVAPLPSVVDRFEGGLLVEVLDV